MGDEQDDAGLYHPRFPPAWWRVPLYGLANWANGLAFRDVNFSSAGRPVIKIAEVKNGISQQTKFTTQAFDDAIRVRFGDLIFSWSGQPETSIDAFWWRGPEGWLNQHLFRVTPIDMVDRTFFYYLLRYLNPHFVRIARNKQTTGLGHVTKRDLEAIEVGIPPLPEQRAIAEVLGALDDKIEANRAVAGRAEAIAIRLPILVDKTTPVGAVAHSAHTTVAPAYFAGKEVEHFSLPAFDASRLPLIESGDAIKSGKYLLEGPTVLISKLNPHIPRVWMATPSGTWPAVTSTEFVGLTSATDSPTEVLWALCASDSFRSQLLEMVKGTTGSHQRVSREDILALEIPDPKAMDRDMRETIAALVCLAGGVGRESARLASLRDAMLPRLLSGEFRVREAEALVEEVV
jgi:type I restriction enzyme S subunit